MTHDDIQGFLAAQDLHGGDGCVLLFPTPGTLWRYGGVFSEIS
jgi:hypothetical protein